MYVGIIIIRTFWLANLDLQADALNIKCFLLEWGWEGAIAKRKEAPSAKQSKHQRYITVGKVKVQS